MKQATMLKNIKIVYYLLLKLLSIICDVSSKIKLLNMKKNIELY